MLIGMQLGTPSTGQRRTGAGLYWTTAMGILFTRSVCPSRSQRVSCPWEAHIIELLFESQGFSAGNVARVVRRLARLSLIRAV